MRYPNISEEHTEQTIIRKFGGYRRRLYIEKGEFYDTENLSLSHDSLVSTRPKRGVYAEAYRCRGVAAGEKLCYLDGDTLRIGEESVLLSLTDGEKKLLSFGNKLLIFPDCVYVNTENTEDRGAIGVCVNAEEATLEPCTAEGAVYTDTAISAEEPEYPRHGALWLDCGKKPYALYRYDEDDGFWTREKIVDEMYIRISCEGLGGAFSAGEQVCFSGFDEELNGIHKIEKAGDGYLVILGMVTKSSTCTGDLAWTAVLPEMDFVTVADGRLWGCGTAVDENGNKIRRIYASAKNNFRSFGDAAYVTDVCAGTHWTGACTYRNEPLFFDSSSVFTVKGKAPQFYRVERLICPGVSYGDDASIATVGDSLCYRGGDGIYLYKGAFPEKISEPLPDLRLFRNASAGALENRYYISMTDYNGAHVLFVYDRTHGVWYREDETRAFFFCAFADDLFYWNAHTGRIMSVGGTGKTETKPIVWSAATGLFGLETIEEKTLLRLDLRVRFETHGTLHAEIEYDSSGERVHLHTEDIFGMKTVRITLMPRPCDHFRIYLSGKGAMELSSMILTRKVRNA